MRVVACVPPTACNTGMDAVVTPVLISKTSVTAPAPEQAIARDADADTHAPIALSSSDGSSTSLSASDSKSFRLTWTMADVVRRLSNYKATGFINHGNTCFINATLQVVT